MINDSVTILNNTYQENEDYSDPKDEKQYDVFINKQDNIDNDDAD